MARGRGEPSRAAVLGASSAEGARLREAMAAAGIPGSRVELFGPVGDDAVLSEYDGEARLVRIPEAGELRSFDVILVADEGCAAWIEEDVAAAALIVDLTGTLPRAPLVGDGAHLPTAGRIAVPHSLSIVLARLIVPIDESLGVSRATATVLRPAADRGRQGLEELRQQTVALLRFEPLPQEVLGRQLAFNVIPQFLAAPDGRALESRVAAEVAGLASRPGPRTRVRLISVPVFHGHAISLHVELVEPVPAERIREALSAARGVRIAGDPSFGTPVEMPDESGTTVFDLSEDGDGGVWLWAVAGEGETEAARKAVEVVAFAPGIGRETGSPEGGKRRS